MVDGMKFDTNNGQCKENERETIVVPTGEELKTLHHISDRIPSLSWLIIIFVMCQTFAYYGHSILFQNYIQFPVPGPGNDQPGALNQGQQTATALTSTFNLFTLITPIFGAIAADQYWGKFRTIAIASVLHIIAELILVVTSIPVSIRVGLAFPGLIVMMIIFSFASGGIHANLSSFMAEQYMVKAPSIREIRGTKKIVHPTVTTQSMFSWYYWGINIGALSTVITTIIEKYHSFWLAYLISSTVFLGSILILFIGRQHFVRVPSHGSLLIRAWDVVMKAVRTQFKSGRQKGNVHWLDYAKCVQQVNSSDNTENSADVNAFIDDLKQAIRVCHVFLFYPFYTVCYNQYTNNLISQAAQMNVGSFPNDFFQVIDPIVLIVFIPAFDKIIYPSLRRWNIHLRPILRITIGFFFISLAMGWTAFVQHLIYSTGPNYSFETKPCETCQKFNDISVIWQIPSYFLIAISEIFACITAIEYAFTHSPESMKSIVMSMFLFAQAIGNALNFILIPLTVDPWLFWMYTILAIVVLVVGFIFYIIFHRDDTKNKINVKKNNDFPVQGPMDLA